MEQETSNNFSIESVSDDVKFELLHADDPLLYPHGCVCCEYIALYKYITIKALYSFLNYGDLKITFPEDANDPYEFVSNEEKPEQRTSEEGFISLSEEENIPSLWGNYAEEYKGACLEFLIPFFTSSTPSSDIKAFVNVFCQENDHNAKIIGARAPSRSRDYIKYLGFDPSGGDIFYKCRYSDAPYCKNTKYTPPQTISDKVKDIYRQCMKIFDRIATKSTAWHHEKEYRIALSKSKRCLTRIIYVDGKQLYLSDRLKPFCSKIILAPYSPFSVNDAKEIMEKAKPWKDKAPKIVRAEFVKGQYKLYIPD